MRPQTGGNTVETTASDQRETEALSTPPEPAEPPAGPPTGWPAGRLINWPAGYFKKTFHVQAPNIVSFKMNIKEASNLLYDDLKKTPKDLFLMFDLTNQIKTYYVLPMDPYQI